MSLTCTLSTLFSRYIIFKSKITIIKNKLLFFAIVLASTIINTSYKVDIDDKRFVTYHVNPAAKNIQLLWKNDKNEIFRSIQNLKDWLNTKNKELIFAMNGGMYKEDNSPLGLYIENSKVVTKLNTANGYGNFYLKPNGVLYITTDNKAYISRTENFKYSNKIKYATQSGPMLLINGNINSAFTKGSTNLNVRNGVGIMPDKTLVFAMSKEAINFYDFAEYFKNIGCTNALYLDGFVSRTYLPEKNWKQTDGDFGVMIAVTEAKK